MNVETIRMMANDANLKLDAAAMRFGELVAERCAVLAERCDGGDGIAERIRDYFEIASYTPRELS